jgi:hypothetical protein
MPLKDATTAAAQARIGTRKFSHQYRLPNDLLRRSAKALARRSHMISAATSFVHLFATVDQVRAQMRGLGDLWAYDTALRIGACVSAKNGPTTALPTDVFLQSGARQGAINLQGNVMRRHRSAPPTAFRQEFFGLKPHEMENFLCIYKARLFHGMP